MDFDPTSAVEFDPSTASFSDSGFDPNTASEFDPSSAEEEKPKSRVSQIPGQDPKYADLENKPTETDSIFDKALGVLEAGAALSTGIIPGVIGMGQGVVSDVYRRATGKPSKGAEAYAQEAMAGAMYEPKTKLGKEYTKKVGDVMMLAPPVLPELAAVGTLAGAATKQVKHMVKGAGKTPEVIPEITPEQTAYQESKIRPEESVSDVMARKRETEKLKRDAEESAKVTAEEEPLLKAEEEVTPVEEKPVTEEVVPTQEQVEVKPVKPAAPEPKPVVPEEVLPQTTWDEAADVIQGNIRETRVAMRLANIFQNWLRETVPNEQIRGRMTRALEGERKYDKIYTDKEKQELLNGTGKKNAAGYADEGLKGAVRGLRSKQERLERNPLKSEEAAQIKERADRLQNRIDYLEALPSEEHAIPVMQKIKDRFANIGERAKSEGVLEDLRDNYVSHILDFSKSKLDEAQRQDLIAKIFNSPKESKLNRDFTQHRQYEFLRELEEAVKGTGVVVHTDIATIMHAYETSMETAMLNKRMVSKLSTTNAPDGTPWMMPRSDEAINNGYREFTGKGSKPIRGLVVHPDLVDAMNFVYRQTDPSMVLKALQGVTYLTKTLNTVGSLFHAKSLFEAGALTDPKLMLKEVVTGGSGMRKAFENFAKNGGDEMSTQWLRDGLVVEVEDIKRSIIADTGKFIDDTISKLGPDLKIVQHLTDPLDQQVIQRLNSFTWDYMHAGQKLNVANHLHGKFKAKNPNATPEQISANRKEIADYVNNTFGGVDWFQVARSVQNKYARAFAMKAAGIQGREWAQIVLFAPDWTVSTLRAATKALPRELAKPQNWQLREGVKGIVNPKTSGDLARRYVITTAIVWATILNGINQATSGHPIWENKDPTRIDMGDGTTIQAAKHSMEAMHWLQHPAQTLGNKLGFFPKAVFVGITGIAYPSPNAPKLKDTSALGRAKAIALLGAPFQVSTAIQAPEGEGAKRALMSTLGVPVYGQTKDQYLAPEKLLERKQKRAERKVEKLMKEMEK